MTLRLVADTTNATGHHCQTLDGILAVRLPRRIGIELLLSVTGEAEAGSAGEEDLRPSNILTRDAFENAMRVGMAVGGSTNMVLHFMAMAKEAGVDVSFETGDALSRTTPTLGYSYYRTRWQDGWGNWHWGRCVTKWWGRGAFQQT
jgi:hypothetical protein